MTDVLVIIPVYNSFDLFSKCIETVITSLPLNSRPFEIVVVNDASSDPRISVLLHHLSTIYCSLTVLTNSTNLGFVRTANAGFIKSYPNDVIILNSDTIVNGNWVDRLYTAAYQNDNIGTVTPLTNDGTICSYPSWITGSPAAITDIETLDNLFNSIDPLSIEIPTCVGFCTYIKRNVLNEVGMFNYHKFGRGYGEENDFSIRCIRHGYINICTTSVYVGHVGSGSFGAEKQLLEQNALAVLSEMYPLYNKDIHSFIGSSPMRHFYKQVLTQVTKLPLSKGMMEFVVKSKESSCPTYKKNKTITNNYMILHVLHGWGGGTEKHVEEISQLTEQQKLGNCLILKPTRSADGSETTVVVYNIQQTFRREFCTINEYDDLVEFLKSLNVTFVHYHHTINVPTKLTAVHETLNVPYYVTAHDFYLGCPRINLISFDNKYCGVPANPQKCNKCISALGRLGNLPAYESIEQWRSNSIDFLSKASDVFAPSLDVIAKFKKMIPSINISLRQHPEPGIAIEDLRNTTIPSHSRQVNVLLVGAIGVHKGSRVLLDVVKASHDRHLPLKFHLVGYTDIDDEFAQYNNIVITGKYNKDTFVQLVKNAEPHIAFFPALSPETYCFTLSEVMALNIPCIGFSDCSGAIQQRIHDNTAGTCIPWDNNPTNIARKLISLGKKLANINIRFKPVTYDNILVNYYGITDGK